jgi:hypothetical protein
MLQYLYNETEAAAEEIVEVVAPALDETSKEEIAEAAADQAEAITDAVAEASAAEGAEFSEEQYDTMHATLAQVIYTSVMSELACQQACYAMEDLFTEEAVEAFYASLEEQPQEQYSGKIMSFIKNKHAQAGAAATVGAVGGAVIGKKIAAKKGMSTKKGAIIGALVGGAALGGGRYGIPAATAGAKKGYAALKAKFSK